MFAHSEKYNLLLSLKMFGVEMYEQVYETEDLDESEIDDYLQWQLIAVQKEELLQNLFGVKFNRLFYKDLRSFFRLSGSVSE